MIDFYYSPTPLARKLAIMLEGAEIPCWLVPLNLAEGEQYCEPFVSSSTIVQISEIVVQDSSRVLHLH